MTPIAAFNANGDKPRKVLVFSTGSLGDTLLVVPALRALRAWAPGAELVLLGDVQTGSGYVVGRDILVPGGLVDRALTYSVRPGSLGRLLNLGSKLALLALLWREGFDTLVYCVEAYRGDGRVGRDRRFFRSAGIRRFIGMDGLEARPQGRGPNINRVANRADELLDRLAASGVAIANRGQGALDLNLQPAERADFEQWRTALPSDGGRPWLAIGPGSKMPAKVWPSERFLALGQRLIDALDLWPVVFGGPEDTALAEQLIRGWGRGYVAAGALGVRASAVGLARCRLYVGNDTGTMHLASAAGIPCVAIFSAREPPGRWEPYGTVHRVLRVDIDCAGCRLVACVDRAMACLARISVDEVYAACLTALTPTGSSLPQEV